MCVRDGEDTRVCVCVCVCLLSTACFHMQVQDIINAVDVDGSGKLDFPEFLNLMTSRHVVACV